MMTKWSNAHRRFFNVAVRSLWNSDKYNGTNTNTCERYRFAPSGRSLHRGQSSGTTPAAQDEFWVAAGLTWSAVKARAAVEMAKGARAGAGAVGLAVWVAGAVGVRE